MEEYKIGNAVVRIKGNPSRETLEAAATKFFKDIEKAKRKKKEKPLS